MQAGLRAAEAQLLAQRATERSEEVSAAAGARPAMPLEAADVIAAAEELLAAEAMLAANPALEAAKCARLEVDALVVLCTQEWSPWLSITAKLELPGLLSSVDKACCLGACRQPDN